MVAAVGDSHIKFNIEAAESLTVFDYVSLIATGQIFMTYPVVPVTNYKNKIGFIRSRL